MPDGITVLTRIPIKKVWNDHNSNAVQYEVILYGTVIFKGTSEEIGEKFSRHPDTVRKAYSNGVKLCGLYTILKL